MTGDQRRLYRDWKALVNLSGADVERFADSPLGRKAGLSRSEASAQGIRSGRDSARAIVRMKRKSVDDWTAADWEWAQRQVAFIRRMTAAKGPLLKEGHPTRRLGALLLWGHLPRNVRLRDVLQYDAYAHNPENPMARGSGVQFPGTDVVVEGPRENQTVTVGGRVVGRVRYHEHEYGDPQPWDAVAAGWLPPYHKRFGDPERAARALAAHARGEQGQRKNASEYYDWRVDTLMDDVMHMADDFASYGAGSETYVDLLRPVFLDAGLQPEAPRDERTMQYVERELTDQIQDASAAQIAQYMQHRSAVLQEDMAPNARNAGNYYVWLLRRGALEPMEDEGPYGPHDLDTAKTFARIGATEGEHDRVVSRGRWPGKRSFAFVRRYQAGTGKRLL